MFFYIRAKTFTSAQVGQIQKEVRCERCPCEYTYQMVRRGMGQSMSVYGLGEKGAKEHAQSTAAVKLSNLLKREHDPVACPDCGWIQTCMVEAMRERAHRWVSKTGWILAILLVASAVFAFLGAAFTGSRSVDENQIVWIAGLALAGIFAAMGGMGARSAWSMTTNPNRDYPHRPSPIPGAPIGIKRGGTPPPLASLAPEAAQVIPQPGRAGPPPLVPASNALSYEQANPLIEAGGWVTVQLAKAQYPLHCCSCLTGTTTLKQFKCAQLSRIAIPMCKDCDKQRIADETFGIISGLVWGGCIAFLFSLYVPWMNHAPIVWTALGVGVGLVIALCMNGIANPVKFSAFNAELNTIRLRFRNPAYLRLLVDHGKLA